MNPDDVCEEYSSRGAKIEIRQLDDDTIVVEGNQSGLEFLGQLLIAQGGFSKDCGFQISPRGAGLAFFRGKSSLGLYIHRTSVEDQECDTES